MLRLIFIGCNIGQKSNSNALKTFSSTEIINHSIVGNLGTCITPHVHVLSCFILICDCKSDWLLDVLAVSGTDVNQNMSIRENLCPIRKTQKCYQLQVKLISMDLTYKLVSCIFINMLPSFLFICRCKNV